MKDNPTRKELIEMGYFQSEDDPNVYFKKTDDPLVHLVYVFADENEGN